MRSILPPIRTRRRRRPSGRKRTARGQILPKNPPARSPRRSRRLLRRSDLRDLSRHPIMIDLQSAYFRAAGTRMRQHPVPSRAVAAYLQYRLLMTCSLLISFVYYKVATFCFWVFFWLHQRGIPRHTCRFYCCLAAHQRTRKKDSAEPSFPILWTPPHPPGVIRCGGAYLLPRFIPI